MPQPARKTASNHRERAARRGAGAPVRPPKATQLERLIEALVELSGQHGYQNISIAQISARAGVSSATFYEQFADKEECLLAAYATLSQRTLTRMQKPLSEGNDWSHAARGAFGELLASLQADPDGGRVMFVEALTGGPRMREELSAVQAGMEETAEALLDQVSVPGTTLDLPARALMGAVRAVVSRHLRTYSEDRLPELTDDLLAWMGSYGVPAGGTRWSTSPAAMLALERTGPDAPADVPPPELDRLPRGRHGLGASVVARSQRTRIVYATAWVTLEKGYANTTVADVVGAAGVAKEAFYRHFRDKEEAFLEAQRYGTHFVFDALVGAFFSADTWPERVWRCLDTLLDVIASNKTLAHLRFVESYVAGGNAIRLAEDTTRTFTMFLEEGYSQREEARELSRLYSQAIAGAIFEMIQSDAAAGALARLPERLPQLAYIAIAPFTGPTEAIELVTAMAARKADGAAPAA